jgi:alpha,alpha-trehalose phosphorylase
LVAGFGGLREGDGWLSFDPALPIGLSGLSFTIRWRGVRLKVAIDPVAVKYSVHDGPDAALTLRHAGEEITVRADQPVVRTLEKRRPLLPRPPQPLGREPRPAMAINEEG